MNQRLMYKGTETFGQTDKNTEELVFQSVPEKNCTVRRGQRGRERQRKIESAGRTERRVLMGRYV